MMDKVSDLKVVYRDPYKVVIISLLILAIINLNFSAGLDSLTSVLIVVLSSVLTDSLASYIMLKRTYISETAIISGLILSLVISPGTPIVWLVLAPALAQISKHIIRYKNKPVFNPAGFGMFLVFLFFFNGESWWGNSMVVATIILGLHVSYRIMRISASLSFLGSIIIFTIIKDLIISGSIGIESAVTVALSQVFLALFMIVDPKSATIRKDGQVICGITAGLVLVLGYVLNLPIPPLLGLLCANIVATRYK